MKIIVTGSSGLVGSELVSFLEGQGHSIKRLVRDKAKLKEPGFGFWDPENHILDPVELIGYDAVVNLAGESISEGRWTEAKKKRLLSSRIDSTTLLSKTMETMENPPKIFINASAIGYYGNRGEETLDEQSIPGNGFLADVCQQWENATKPAIKDNIRVVILRFGVVLSSKGGALQKMLTPFRLGLGGCIGSGKQNMSWIAIQDLVRIILYILETPSIQGVVNAVSPNPVTNKEFTKTLGSQLQRPTLFCVPAFAARWVFGEMADELLLASTKVVPKELLQKVYTFLYPTLEATLKDIIY